VARGAALRACRRCRRQPEQLGCCDVIGPSSRRTVSVWILLLALSAFGAVTVWAAWLQLSKRRVSRQAESELRSSEAHFRGMVEGSMQGMMVHRSGVPIFANRAYAAILGYEHPRDIIALGDTKRIYAPYEIERMEGYRETCARAGGANRV
jgi:PAS domain-containing protein